jgi:hypothetical protein
MNRRPRVGLLPTAITAIGVFLICGVFSHRASPQPDLWVSKESLDLGDVWAQRSMPVTLQIHNSAVRDILLENIGASCQCATIDPRNVMLPAGGKANLSLTSDLLPPSVTESFNVSHPTTITIVGHCFQPYEKSYAWAIHFNARNPLMLSMKEAVLDEAANLFVPDHIFRSEQIDYNSPVPLREIKARADQSDVDVLVWPKNETSGVLEIRPTSRIPAGRFVRQISLSGTQANGERIPAVTFNINGVSLRDVHCLPKEIMFGPAEIGTQLQATIRINSATRRHFSVERVESDDATLLVNRRQDSDPVEFDIRQLVTRLGRQGAIVIFHIASTDRDMDDDVRLPVSYIGVDGEVLRQ